MDRLLTDFWVRPDRRNYSYHLPACDLLDLSGYASHVKGALTIGGLSAYYFWESLKRSLLAVKQASYFAIREAYVSVIEPRWE